MRNILLILCFAVFIFSCTDNQAEHNHDSKSKVSIDSSKKSIPTEVKKWVGNTNIKINYHAPSVRGRVIWGGLVPYDEVWVTGAHSATTIEIGKPFHAGDKILPAGKYALFTIPGKEEWTVIINKNWEQHLADEYDEKDDLVRIKVKPQTTEEITERLSYEIDQTGERTADIIISWEKIRVMFGVEIR